MQEFPADLGLEYQAEKCDNDRMSEQVDPRRRDEVLRAGFEFEAARGDGDVSFDARESVVPLPAELEQAIADGAFDGLLLDVQGTGLMVDADDAFLDDSTAPIGASSVPPDLRRMGLLRAKLGVTTATPSPEPRRVPAAASDSFPKIQLESSEHPNRTSATPSGTYTAGAMRPRGSGRSHWSMSVSPIYVAAFGGLVGFAAAISVGWLVLSLLDLWSPT